MLSPSLDTLGWHLLSKKGSLLLRLFPCHKSSQSSEATCLKTEEQISSFCTNTFPHSDHQLHLTGVCTYLWGNPSRCSGPAGRTWHWLAGRCDRAETSASPAWKTAGVASPHPAALYWGMNAALHHRQGWSHKQCTAGNCQRTNYQMMVNAWRLDFKDFFIIYFIKD